MDPIREALRKAAEAITGKPISDAEADRLKRLYGTQRGTPRQKARGALRGYTGLSEADLQKRQASSDDTDRKVRDAEGTADRWDP